MILLLRVCFCQFLGIDTCHVMSLLFSYNVEACFLLVLVRKHTANDAGLCTAFYILEWTNYILRVFKIVWLVVSVVI